MALHDAGYPVAVQPNAKGMVPESHDRFIGMHTLIQIRYNLI